MSFNAQPPAADMSDMGNDDEVLELVSDPGTLPRQNMPELSDEGISQQPDGLFQRWRSIEPEQMPAIWQDLRAWVDWLIAEYGITKQAIPSCWYRHRPIVAELYAMRCAEEAVWASDGPQTTAAFQFHPYLYAMLQRLSNFAGKCLSAKKHVEEQGFGNLAPNSLSYDEADWNDFMLSQTQKQTLPRDEKETVYWRRVVEYIDAEGETRTLTSEILPVGARKKGLEPQIMPLQILALQQDEVLVANTVQVPFLARSVWESSKDQQQWEELETSIENLADGIEAVDEETLEA